MFDLKNKSDLDYQVKFLGFIESLQAVHRWVLVLFIAVALGAVPMFYILRQTFFSLIYVERNLGVASVPQGDPVIVREDKILSNGMNAYFAYARIANPNPDLAAKKLDYTFTLKGSGGQVLAEYSGVSFILPDQEKLIFMPARIYEERPTAAEVTVEAERWSRANKFKNLDFFVEGLQYGNLSSGAYYVSAILRNGTPYIIPNVEVTVILYDLNHEVISVNFTTLTDLQLYESRFFRVQWPSGIKEKVYNVEVRPEVNQLINGSLITPSAGVDTRLQD